MQGLTYAASSELASRLRRSATLTPSVDLRDRTRVDELAVHLGSLLYRIAEFDSVRDHLAAGHTERP